MLPGEKPSSVRGHNTNAWESIEKTLENHVRQRDGRVERKADVVDERAGTSKPPATIFEPGRVQQDDAAEFVSLLPERLELGIHELVAVHVGADRESTQAELPHRVVHLFGGQRAVLKGHVAETHGTCRDGPHEYPRSSRSAF